VVIGLLVDVLVGVELGVVGEVEFVLQDNSTSDVTMRQVNPIQIAPLFIWASFLVKNF